MSYFSVLDVTPTAEEWIPAYLPTANKLVTKHGGKYVARTTSHEQVEGKDEGPVGLRIIISWPSKEAALAFMSDPEKYAPANGGYCTFGVVLAKKFDGDPEVWSVHDDRLHVFLNQEVKEKFLQDEPGNLVRVAENWPIIRDKSPEELEAS